MINATISDDYTVINVSVTTDATLIRNLINTALSGLSKTMPEGDVIQVILTPADTITAQDERIGSEMTLVAGIAKVYPCDNTIDILKLKSGGAVACQVEMYIQKK